MQEFLCLLLPTLGQETSTPAVPPRTASSTQSPGVDFYCRRRFLQGCGYRRAAAAASHAAFTGKSHFCRTLAPVPSSCAHGLCSLHIRGTSESPFIIHSFVFLALIFAGPLALSVGSKGHPEQFPPSSSSFPSLGCHPLPAAPAPRELHFLYDQREIGGK